MPSRFRGYRRENEEHREVNYDGAELTNHEAMSNEGDEGSVDKETAPGMCSYLYQQYTCKTSCTAASLQCNVKQCSNFSRITL